MDWLLELLIGLCIAVPLRLWVVNIARIRGGSMLPTLQDREWALVWRLPCRLRGPKRQDVVICHYPGRKTKWCRWIPQAFVKRVIGMPGDTLEIIEGAVYINGELLSEPYLDPERCRYQRTRPARILGSDEYFVMGDHRDRSNDSRSIGPIPRNAVRGRVICTLFPFRRIRKVR